MKHLLLLGLCLLSMCSVAQRSLNQLESKTDFDRLSGLPLSEKYGEVSALKLVYNLNSQELHFLNTKYFKYHFDFCESQRIHDVDVEDFNALNYGTDPGRKYLLGNLNYYESLGIYALELAPSDLMSTEYILQFYELVTEATYIGDSLHLLLNNHRLQQLRPAFQHKVPMLDPAEVYAGLNFQAIGKHSNCGYLRIVDDLEAERADLHPTDIVVINETPLSLPALAGIIVSEFQTPLSHLTILGQNRKIPIAAYKLAFEDSTLLKLDGERVYFNVSRDDWSMYPSDNPLSISSRPRRIKLKFNLECDSLMDADQLARNAHKYAGNKAANFGTLVRLSQKHDFMVPEAAFVIPFHFYDQHVSNCGAQQVIDALFTGQWPLNEDTLKQRLALIQARIRTAPVDAALIDAIKTKVEANDGYKRLRFRSSTNAEDAKGFSGAGLYTSKTGIYGDDNKSFDRAIKLVWASLWSFEAFTEREYYGIDHRQAYMGILVHRSFPSEAVNGVAITKNLYRPDSYGFVVNAQKGEESVVEPSPGVISDQFICYPDNLIGVSSGNGAIEIITRSNISDGTLVMTENEINHLANQLEAIKEYFKLHTMTSKTYAEFGLDIEFKLDGEHRDLYIKQVRLYNH